MAGSLWNFAFFAAVSVLELLVQKLLRAEVQVSGFRYMRSSSRQALRYRIVQ